VTDPSGATLLSTTDITAREVCLDANGYFVNTTTPDLGPEVIDGKCPNTIAVLISPFDQTPNPGNEYKAWITPISAYEPGSGVFGFIPSDSKTDNFKFFCGNGTQTTSSSSSSTGGAETVGSNGIETSGTVTGSNSGGGSATGSNGGAETAAGSWGSETGTVGSNSGANSGSGSGSVSGGTGAGSGNTGTAASGTAGSGSAAAAADSGASVGDGSGWVSGSGSGGNTDSSPDLVPTTSGASPASPSTSTTGVPAFGSGNNSHKSGKSKAGLIAGLTIGLIALAAMLAAAAYLIWRRRQNANPAAQAPDT